MDFENLAKTINKVPLKWSSEDVAKWLSFIGLDHLQKAFRTYVINRGSEAIDGSKLQDLQPEDLEKSLNITSGILRKKLMNWIKVGLKEFTQYLTINNKENINRQKYDNMDIQPEEPVNYVGPITGPIVQKVKQLIIIPEEGTHSSKFCVSEEGGRIGRHSTNNILVIEESVSRFHASIVYDKKKELFKLMDLKSSTGTYIKIDAQLVLTKDMIIELGSYHFQVTSIRSDQDIAELILLIVEGNPLNKDIRLSCKTSQPTSFKIGRKETNEVFFEDTHMSNVHANISYSNGKFVFEDMSSTNGSWLKLTEDDPTYLENNSVFKIGTLSIYKCQYTDAKRTIDQTRSDNCVVCYQNDKDALYMPCKHNLVCLKCSKMMKECPVCREKIAEIIRIYK